MPLHQEKLTYFKFLLRNFGYLRREFLLLALTHNESTVEHTLASAVEPYSVPYYFLRVVLDSYYHGFSLLLHN